MKIFIDDEEIKEIPIFQVPTVIDGTIVIPDALGRKKDKPNKSQLQKEIIALDTVDSRLSQKSLAQIHGITQTEVSIHGRAIDRSNIDGRKSDNELKDLINAKKYSIADAATSRLMESLDLFNPTALDQKDLPAAASKMAAIVERVTQGFEGAQTGPQILFQVYAPRTRSEDTYDVIVVDE